MIEASCHCGAVRFDVDEIPADVNSCNCSICRRYGVLWAYYRPRQVHFAPDNQATDIYVWGDKDLEFHRCRICGCLAYWKSVDAGYDRMGVNARLMDPATLAKIPVRFGDGASM